MWAIDTVTPLPDGSVPTAESTPEEFQVFDEAVTDYMEERGVTSAALAVAVDGEEVYRQGYGWMRPSTDDASPVVSSDTLFRLASITKPYNEVVVRHLAQQEALSLSDRAFCLESTSSSCHLEIDPYDGDLGDQRLQEITIQHLLDHQGGWDRAASGDPMFENVEIANAMDVPSPPSAEQVTSYMLSQPLDFAPGNGYAYSNFGYVVLGLIVEKVTGDDFVDQVKHVAYDVPLDEVGTAEEDGVDVEKGYTLTPERNEREPTYHCPGIGPHVFDPARQANAETCWPDGGWALEPMEANGGLIASAPSVLDFVTDYWLWGEERDGSCGSCYAWFFGSLSGTLTLAQQRTDGLDFVILTNKRWDSDHGYHHDSLQETVNQAADEYMAEHGGSVQAAGDCQPTASHPFRCGSLPDDRTPPLSPVGGPGIAG